MWPGMANSDSWRSPQASARTPNNTREPARSGKKKPQPRTVGVSILVGWRQLNHSSYPAKFLDITLQFLNMFPGLFPGLRNANFDQAFN